MSIKEVLKMIFNWIIYLFKWIFYIVEVFLTELIDTIIYLWNATNSLLKKTWYKYQILFWFWFFLVLFFSYFIFKPEIYSLKFEYHIWVKEREMKNIESKKLKTEKNIEWLSNTMTEAIKELKVWLENFIVKEREYCVQENVLNFLKEQKALWNIVDKDMIDISELEIKNSMCQIENFRDLAYTKFLNVPIENEIKNHFNKMVEEDKKEAIIREEKIEKIIEEKLEKTESVVVEWEYIPSQNVWDYVDKKMDWELKAFFCDYWHWEITTTNKWSRSDRWAVNHNSTEEMLKVAKETLKEDYYNIIKDKWFAEREIILEVMDRACTKMEKSLEPLWVKVYRIWKESISLEDRIEKINYIAKKNWYDETNSLLVSLHMNSLQEWKKWIEVFYSQLETPNHWKQWPDFAWKVMYFLRKVHTYGNVYNIKSDKKTRFWMLWILSNTKPLSIVVELWVVKNEEDVIFNMKNLDKLSNTLAESWMSFIGK